MADIYLSSVDGSDSDDGSTWALAKATLAAAITAAGNGGRVFMDNAHAESVGATLLPNVGTSGSPVQILCVDRTGNPEPPTALATTGTYTATGSNAIGFAGDYYIYGVTISAGGNINFTSTTHRSTVLDSCHLDVGADAATNRRLNCGASSGTNLQYIKFKNTKIEFGHVNQGIIPNCVLVFCDTTTALQGTVPTTLFLAPTSSPRGSIIEIAGVDLSAAGSGNNLFDVSFPGPWTATLRNCKLGASVAITTGTSPGLAWPHVTLVNCDSADTNYRYLKNTYQGEITHETTIVRTGGASDGTTGFSRKMVSSANSKLYSPLEADPLQIWNETVGSAVTVTVEVVTDNVTLTDAEAWIEVEYLGTSGFPLALFASDRAANILSTPANQASSTETWTTTGLTTPVKQKLSATFTPQEKGWIQVRVMLAKASTTMYFCPKVDVT